MLDPCENCKEKTVDEYGLYCDIFCGLATAYSNHQAGVREVVEFASPLMGKINDIIADIRGDWTDPRQNCRDAHQLIAEWQAKLKEWENAR